MFENEFTFRCSKCKRLVDLETKENLGFFDTSTYTEDGMKEHDYDIWCENCNQEINDDRDHIDLGEYNITLTDAKKITKMSTEEMLKQFNHIKCEGHYDNIITYFRNKDIDKFNKKPKVDEWI